MKSNIIVSILSIFVTLVICYFIIRRDITMAMVYVSLIIKGKRTYKSVPDLIKPQVKEILIDLELDYLIDE